ncbi:MAG: CHASE2 domain-containing protein [Pseudoxanthomonas sp.]
MNANRSWKTRVKARLLTGVTAAALVSLLILGAATWRADAWIYDQLARRFSAPVDERIVVLAIDEKSLAELGRWPWSRRIHAALINRLTAAGAKGVAMNILLSEPALFDPEGDALLAQALSRNGKVVLPVYVAPEHANGTAVELLPIPEFAGAAASLGHVDMPVDADGVARSAFLRAGLGSAHWPALALALSQIGTEPNPAAALPGLRGSQPGKASPQRWMRDYQVLVPYLDADDAFRTVSYADVMGGRVADPVLRGRWILIGVTAPGMGNEPATFAAANPAQRSGVDYQANLLNMLLQGNAAAPLGLTAQILLSTALVALPLLLLGLRGLPDLRWPIAIAGLLVVVTSVLLLRLVDVWFPPVPALSVLALAALLVLLRLLRRMRQQAQSDPLTRLPNRSRFDQELEQELRLAESSEQPLSLLLLDLDHFKRLNDRLGQPAGDKILCTFSEILRGRARRPRDLVARLGGDQFAVLLPETTPQSAAAIATTIHVDLANLSTRSSASAAVTPFTTSIGIHTVPAGSEPIGAAEVIERADAALYQAKQAGRNRSFSHTGDNAFSSH